MRRRFTRLTLPLILLSGAIALHAHGQVVSAAEPVRTQRDIGSATAAFRAGSEASARGDLRAAETFFRRAVHLAPRVAAAHTALGSVLSAEGRLGEADAELTHALRINPKDATALLNLSIVDSLEGKDHASAETFQKLQAIDSNMAGTDSAEAAIPIAAALSRTGELAAAERLLSRGVFVHPKDAALADALGTIEAAQGRYGEAEVELQRSVELDQQRAESHFHLGADLFALGQLDAARQESARAYELDSANTSYTLQLARVLDANGAERDVVTLLEAALQKAPAGQAGTEMRYRLALALQYDGQTKQSLPLFAAVLAERPRDTGVLVNAGLAKVQTGDATGGIALYRQALAAGPVTATLREDLGVAYLQEGKLEEALKQFQAGLALDGQNPQLHYDLGLAYKLKDKLANAVPEFLESERLDPSLPDPPYTLGIIYMQQGNFAQAAERLTRATELRPDNGDAWAALGSVYRDLSQPDRAEVALRRAIVLLPDQPSPHINLGSMLMAEGKKVEAIAERKKGAELTRIAVNRQKASFAINSGAALLKQGKIAEALVQYRMAVATDPQDAAAHDGMAAALQLAGRKAEAAEERRKASELTAALATP